MLNRLLSILVALALPVFASSQNTISIPGIGTLPVTKTGEKYTVDLGKMGTFDFSGTLSPLDLTVAVTVEQMKSFPGYKIYKDIGMQDIVLHLTTEGFSFEANIDTRKKMGTLFKFLKISEPMLHIITNIQKDGFALEGQLDFEKEPVKIDLVPQLGTRFTLQNLRLSANVGVSMEEKVDFSPGVTIATQLKIKPTKWDPDLQSEITFSYDLVSQEISGSGAILDTWKNPFGLSNHFNKDVFVLTNSAIELGWVIGSPSPTKLGFVVEQGKFFQIDFGVGLDLSPTDAQIAIMAKANKLTLNEFTTILRDGFGLGVPDIFPNDLGIKNPEVLFSPNGGDVAGIEIPKGIVLKGQVELLGAVKASLDFHTDMAAAFYLDMNIDADIKKALMKEIKKVKPLAPIMKQILSTLEIKKVHLHLEADQTKNLIGETQIKLSVLHKPLDFKVKGAVNVDALVDAMIKEITKLVGPEIAEITRKISGTVAAAGKKSKQIASKALDEAERQAKIVSKHATHSKEHCDKNCIPKHARNVAGPVLSGSNDAVRQFYEDVIGELGQISGETAAETAEIRSSFVKQEWDNLVAGLDADWAKIRKDDSYIRFYLMPSSASNGGKKFRSLVDEEKQKHIDYRNTIWNKLMTETREYNPEKQAEAQGTVVGRRFIIQSAMNYGKNNGGCWDIPGHPQVVNKGSNIQVWNLDDGHDRVYRFHETNEPGFYEIQVGNTSSARVDIDHGKPDNGTNVKVWERNGANAQKFRLQHLGNGRFKIYDKNGKVICLAGRKNNNGSNVHIWEDHNGDWMEWYLVDDQTKQAFVP